MHPFRADKGFRHFTEPIFSDSAHDEFSRLLAAVPAMPEALLKLEAALEHATVDLNGVCAVIRSDLGLALRVLSLGPVPLDPAFNTLEQCVLEVGIASLRTAGQTTPPLALSHRNPPLHADLLGLWHHSKLVAQSAERIAAEGGEVDPDKAYVAGLLHDVLALADKLGSTANLAALFKDKEQIEARRLAQAWKIPSYAIESIETRGVGFRCVGPVATAVAAAHSQIAAPAGHS